MGKAMRWTCPWRGPVHGEGMAMEISMGRTSLWGWPWEQTTIGMVIEIAKGRTCPWRGDDHGKDMSMGMAMRRRWPLAGRAHKVDTGRRWPWGRRDHENVHEDKMPMGKNWLWGRCIHGNVHGENTPMRRTCPWAWVGHRHREDMRR